MESLRKDKKKKFHFFRYLILAFVLFLLIGLAAVPMYLSSEGGKEMIIEKINSNIDGQVGMSGLSVGWFSGIEIQQFDFNDDKGLMRVSVERISSNPSYLSFLGSKPNLGRMVIDKPKVYVKLEEVKTSEGGVEAGPEQVRAAAAPALVKVDLEVNDGDVTIETVGGDVVRFAKLGAKMDIEGENKRNDIDFSVAVEDESGVKHGEVKAQGNLRPAVDEKGWNLSGTSGEFKVRVDSLELGKMSPLFKMIDDEFFADGVVDVNMKVSVDEGEVEELDGMVQCENIDILIPGSGGDRLRSKEIRGDVKIIGSDEAYNFDKFDIVSDWLVVNGSGKLGKKAGNKGSFEARFNFDISRAAKSMPSTFSVREGVDITGGTFSGNLLSLTDEKQREFIVKASLDGLSARADGKDIALSQPVKFDVDVVQSVEEVRVRKGDIQSGFANISCEGTAGALNYTTETNLSGLQNELGKFFDFGGYSFAGKMSQKGVLSFGEARIDTKGVTNVDDLVVSKDNRQAKESGATINYNLQVDRKGEVLNIKSVAYKGGAGEFSFTDSVVYIGDGKGDTNINASANVDLGKLIPFAVMAGALPREYGFSGMLDGDVKATMSGDTVSLFTSGIRIDQPKFSYGGESFFEQDYAELDFDGKLNVSSKSISIESMRLESPQISISKGSLKRSQKQDLEKLEGEFVYDVNLSAVGDLAEPFLPSGFEIYGRQSDKLVFSSQFKSGDTDSMLANLNARTRLGFDRAKYMGMNFGKTEVDVEIKDGLMDIKPFTTEVNGGRLSFAANADFNKKPVLLRMPEPMKLLEKVEITKEMSDEMLKYLNPVFSESTSVTGFASFDCDGLVIPVSGGNRDDIIVAGTVDMNDIRISGSGILAVIARLSKSSADGEIVIEPTDFMLARGVLHYDDMAMYLGSTPLNFGGDMYLAGPIDLYIQVPVELGGERLKLFFEGTVSEPKLNVEKILQDALRQQIQQGLRDLFK